MTKKKAKSFVPVAKIKANLRRVHLHCKYRAKAKARCKIDIGTYKCETKDCPNALYDGKSEKRFLELKEKWAAEKVDVSQGKIEMDHIIPVVSPTVKSADWNVYLERLWVNDEGYKGLCRTCHAEKTAKESAERKEAGTLKRK